MSMYRFYHFKYTV